MENFLAIDRSSSTEMSWSKYRHRNDQKNIVITDSNIIQSILSFVFLKRSVEHMKTVKQLLRGFTQRRSHSLRVTYGTNMTRIH